MEFIFQYPIWFIIFCLALGAIYAGVLYFKSTSFDEDSFGFKYLKPTMAALRFLSISLLSFLLLSPLLKSRYIDKIQPKIVITHDNSSSVLIGFKSMDSTAYINSFKTMQNALENKYELDFYAFADKIYKKDTLDFKGKKTNISNTLQEINGNYFNQNIGALILASDGIYNEGINPIYTDFSFPIYAIALGDTNQQKDLKASYIGANKIAYLGDKVEVKADIEAFNLKGKKYEVKVYNKTNGVYSKSFSIEKEYIEQKLSFTIAANSLGMQKYTLQLTQLEGEITYENNSIDFYIDVIDSRQKILILAQAPHPDIAALKQSISLNKNLDLDIQYIKNNISNFSKYNLVILHQLPSVKNKAAQVFSELKKEKIPFLIIAGSQTDFTAFNTSQDIVNIKSNGQNTNDASAFVDANFNLFSLDENTRSKIENFPPLVVPFANFKTAANAKIILKQKIGSVQTDFPVLSFQDINGVKAGVFIGEGLWRWRLHDYLENESHEAFDEVFSKTINYLALNSDKRRFRVSTPKNAYFETEELVIDAELYNESYELVNEPEVSLNLKNEKGEDFPLSFSRTNNAYQLKTNNLPVGEYVYEAKVNYANKNYTASGLFSIQALQLEALQTKANHQLLYQLAEKTGGKVFYPNQLDELQELILNKEDIKPTLFETYKTRPIINLKWIFFLIVSLLSVEWFMRKYNGSY